VRGDVLGGRIEHRAEIGEGQFVHEGSRVVLVECGPRAVARPHRPAPPHRVGDGLRRALAFPRLQQCEDDDGGVIDIGVQVVVELECPSTARVERHLDLPVTAAADLLGQKPVDGAAQRHVLTRNPGLAKREHRPRRVPHR
jgi:hypothetical protein